MILVCANFSGVISVCAVCSWYGEKRTPSPYAIRTSVAGSGKEKSHGYRSSWILVLFLLEEWRFSVVWKLWWASQNLISSRRGVYVCNENVPQELIEWSHMQRLSLHVFFFNYVLRCVFIPNIRCRILVLFEGVSFVLFYFFSILFVPCVGHVRIRKRPSAIFLYPLSRWYKEMQAVFYDYKHDLRKAHDISHLSWS